MSPLLLCPMWFESCSRSKIHEDSNSLHSANRCENAQLMSLGVSISGNNVIPRPR